MSAAGRPISRIIFEVPVTLGSNAAIIRFPKITATILPRVSSGFAIAGV